MKLTVILEKTSTGYSAYCKEIDGMTTVGKTSAEIKENFQELIQMRADYLDEQGKEKEANEISKAEIQFFFGTQEQAGNGMFNIPVGKYVICKDIDFNEFETYEDGSIKIYYTFNDAAERVVDFGRIYKSHMILQIIEGGVNPE